MARLPHKVIINGQLIGIMQQPEVMMEIAPGRYRITIQSMFPYLSATTDVEVESECETRLAFRDRERWWDTIMALDLILWIVKSILHLQTPWTWIYEVFTNGYFALWLLYEWHIHDRYFKFEIPAK